MEDHDHTPSDAAPFPVKPDSAYGQLLRTMRGDLERIRSGGLVVPRPPTNPLPLTSHQNTASLPQQITKTPSLPPAPPIAIPTHLGIAVGPADFPEGPLGFDLLAHIAGETPPQPMETPPLPSIKPENSNVPRTPEPPVPLGQDSSLYGGRPAPVRDLATEEPRLPAEVLTKVELPIVETYPATTPSSTIGRTLSAPGTSEKPPVPPLRRVGTSPLTPLPPVSPDVALQAPAFAKTEPPFNPSAESTSRVPLRPEELLALEEETLESFSEGTRSRPRLKFPRITTPIILFAGSVLFAAALALGGYFFFVRSDKPAPTPPPSGTSVPAPPGSSEPLPPPMAIPIASTRTVTITAIEETSIELKTLFAGANETSTLRAVFFKIENDSERRYLSLTELWEALDISMPENVRTVLDLTSWTFFVRGEGESGAPRVGFALKARDAIALERVMTSWEPTLVTDFNALLTSLGKSGGQEPSAFKTTTRNDLTNHYVNFPEPTLSIDYAIDLKNNVLLIATSRATMYAAMDVLPE